MEQDNTNPAAPADGLAREQYAAVRRIAVEHLRDYPDRERTHRLMQLPQALPVASEAQPAQPALRELLRECRDAIVSLGGGNLCYTLDRIDTALSAPERQCCVEERERCAKIAEDAMRVIRRKPGDEQQDQAWNGACIAIRNAIRSRKGDS